MNIALLIDGLGSGGAESVVSQLARGLTVRGHQAHVYCLKTARARAAELRDAGVVVREAGSSGFDPGLARRLWRWLRGDAIDVVHAHSSAALVHAVTPARLLGIPLIQTRHGPLMGRPSRHRRLADTLARFIARVVIVSESLRRDLPAAVARDSLHVPNGIDLEPAPRDPARARLEELCGRSLDGPLVVSVGTICVEKDICGLLRAFAAMRVELPSASLVCIGGSRDEEYAARVDAILRQERLSDCVHLVGSVDHASRYLAGADVFCLSSRSEAAPIAILEAMSQRVPIVATAVGDVGSIDGDGMRSAGILRQGDTALLVPPGDPPALAEALRTALCDRGAARRRAAAAARDYALRYTTAHMTRDYERVYSECILARQRQPRRTKPPQRKPRVLMVGPAPPTIGGMVSVIDGLIAGRLRDRFDLYRFPTCGRRPRTRRTFGLIRSAARHMAALSSLGRVIVENRISLLHIHTCSGFSFYRSLADLLVGKLLGRRVVLHVHGGRFDRFCEGSGRIGRSVIRMGCQVADAVVVLSQRWCDRIAPYAGRARLDVVPNGIGFAPSHTPAAKTAPIRKGVACRFIFVGGLTREKGMHELLDAAATLQKDDVRFELLIAGPHGGPDESNWAEHVRLVGLEQDVSFVGTVTSSAKVELFASADCLVLPSHVEGSPIVILEAAAAGLPVIATDVGSVAELLTIAEPGGAVREICPLVPPRDAAALAAQMSRLALDGALRRQMGSRLRDHVAAHFSADIQVERLTRLYASILPCGIEQGPIIAVSSPDMGRRGSLSIHRPIAASAVLAAERQ